MPQPVIYWGFGQAGAGLYAACHTKDTIVQYAIRLQGRSASIALNSAHNTDHMTTFRISKRMIGKYFRNNLIHAQSFPITANVVPVLKEYRMPRFENRCQNNKCNAIFSSLTSRRKYCSIQCRTLAGVDRFRRKRRGIKGLDQLPNENKRRWSEFMIADMIGDLSVPPPKTKGRLSALQRTMKVEYELNFAKQRRLRKLQQQLNSLPPRNNNDEQQR